jgi:glycerol-3-phosphate dehydrogenase
MSTYKHILANSNLAKQIGGVTKTILAVSCAMGDGLAQKNSKKGG